ncbi:MAG: hypothetical protein EHM19_02520 [Candidatus Latescibacterota bacterium]|nr:MAG: hypothetical protein EHM19_02520 [Candidatus Latescibacterota bacterium]
MPVKCRAAPLLREGAVRATVSSASRTGRREGSTIGPEARPWSARAGQAVWIAAALVVAAWFFAAHPPRPRFAPPGESVAGPGPAEAAAEAGSAVGGALLFALLSTAGGFGLARLLRVERPSVALSFAIGSLGTSFVSLALLAMGQFRVWALAPLLLLPFLLRGRPLPRKVRVGPFAPSLGRAALFLLIGLASVDLLVRVSAPLTSNDSIVYHMTLARSYAESGRLDAAPALVYARMPHGSDILLAGAYLVGGEGAARGLHLIWALAAAALAGALAREAFGRGAGLGAAALFLTTPLVLDPRTIGNADLPAAIFFASSFLLLQRSARDGGRGELAAGALLAGGMLAVKLSAYAAYPLLVFASIAPLPGRPRPGRAGRALLFLFVSHLPLLPWLAKAWVETGNPIFPLFPSVLGGREWDAVLGDRLVAWQRSMGMGRGALPTLMLPWNAILRGAQGYPFFDGVLSPALLLWTPWAWARGGRAARTALLLALAGIYVWGIGPQQLRFLLPVVLLLSSVTGAFWRSEKGAFGRVQGTLFALIAAGLLAPLLAETARDAWPVAIGKEARESYLSRKVQSYEAFRETAARVPEGEKVLLVWENRVYYFPRPFAADSFFEASEAARRAETAADEEDLVRRWKREGIGWLLINRPLGRVFGGHSPERALSLIEGAALRSEHRGSWKGIDLYRLP